MTPEAKALLLRELESCNANLDGEHRDDIPEDAAALIRRLSDEKEKMARALVDIAGPKREHYECEDGWYSCPKHPEYFGNDSREHCSCGADEYNAKLDHHADALRIARERA